MQNHERSSEPNQLIMASRFTVFILLTIMAVIVFLYTSSWILLSIWIGVMVVFYTAARKNICAKCEGYGKKCHSFYMGLYTSKLYPFQGIEEPPTWAAALEGICILTTSALPFVPLVLHFDLKGVPLMFTVYLALFLINFVAQFFHACRHCVLHATEGWKKLCPANKLGQRLWGQS